VPTSRRRRASLGRNSARLLKPRSDESRRSTLARRGSGHQVYWLARVGSGEWRSGRRGQGSTLFAPTSPVNQARPARHAVCMVRLGSASRRPIMGVCVRRYRAPAGRCFCEWTLVRLLGWSTLAHRSSHRTHLRRERFSRGSHSSSGSTTLISTCRRAVYSTFGMDGQWGPGGS
jgi:hypothetical protein